MEEEIRVEMKRLRDILVNQIFVMGVSFSNHIQDILEQKGTLSKDDLDTAEFFISLLTAFSEGEEVHCGNFN